MKKNFLIPLSLANKRLDQALAHLLSEYSRTEIKRWIDENIVFVNGKPSKAKSKVAEGDDITLTIPPKQPILFEAQEIPLNIIYEDESLLLINKPIGLIVHPGAGNKDQTLLNALLHHAPHLRELPRAGIIHRLDKDTSGILVVAKTNNALKSLQHQLKKRTLIRIYQAIVHGTMISGGTISAPIGRDRHERTKMAVIESGKEAITHYRILEKYKAHTRLKVQLETGRTHQIRVHMQYINHPIVGDQTYKGKKLSTKLLSESVKRALSALNRQALHAYSLEFIHPVTNKTLKFKAPLPADISQVIKALQEDNSP